MRRVSVLLVLAASASLILAFASVGGVSSLSADRPVTVGVILPGLATAPVALANNGHINLSPLSGTVGRIAALPSLPANRSTVPGGGLPHDVTIQGRAGFPGVMAQAGNSYVLDLAGVARFPTITAKTRGNLLTLPRAGLPLRLPMAAMVAENCSGLCHQAAPWSYL